MISGVIPGTVEVFAELKATGVPCYALSNMERENWERRIQIYDFLGWFDGYFISGLEGVIKPDSEYFERALERFGLRPTRSCSSTTARTTRRQPAHSASPQWSSPRRKPCEAN